MANSDYTYYKNLARAGVLVFSQAHGLGRILSRHVNPVCGSVWYRVQFRYGIHSVAASRCQAVTAESTASDN